MGKFTQIIEFHLALKGNWRQMIVLKITDLDIGTWLYLHYQLRTSGEETLLPEVQKGVVDKNAYVNTRLKRLFPLKLHKLYKKSYTK